jgi:ribosomal protein S18 acetylase RimI-like enzyme
MDKKSFHIRSYVDKDEPRVARLWREVFPDAPAWNRPEEDIRRKLSVQRDLFLVAEDGEQITGTAMAGYDGHRGWVYYVAVAPDWRRRGLGSALMAEVERRLAQLGCPKLNLQVRAVNEEVVSFYRHLGYAVEERISLGKHLTPLTRNAAGNKREDV